MPRPSFQFYPADWRSNAKLRRCSLAARGAWAEILCTLHDSDEYGVARYPLAELSAAAGVKLTLARELVAKGVLKGSDAEPVTYTYRASHAGKLGPPISLLESNAPCWYSSRMVRDEWVRHQRGRNTRFSDENPPPKASPKVTPNLAPIPPIGGQSGYGPSSSSSSSEETRAADAALGGPKLVHSQASAKGPDADRAALFTEIEEVCGHGSGGLAVQLLNGCQGNILKARGIIHDARQKLKPRDWVIGAIRKRAQPGQDTWGLTGMI